MLGQLVGFCQFFIVDILGDEFGSTLIIVKFGVGELGGPDCGADELTLAALVEGAEEQFTGGIVDDLELTVIFEHVLEDQLLF